MSLRPANATRANLPLESECRSDSHDAMRGFLLPWVERSTGYRRAIGCFASRGPSGVAQGVMALVRGGGRILPVARATCEADGLEAIWSDGRWRGG